MKSKFLLVLSIVFYNVGVRSQSVDFGFYKLDSTFISPEKEVSVIGSVQMKETKSLVFNGVFRVKSDSLFFEDRSSLKFFLASLKDTNKINDIKVVNYSNSIFSGLNMRSITNWYLNNDGIKSYIIQIFIPDPFGHTGIQIERFISFIEGLHAITVFEINYQKSNQIFKFPF